MKQIISSLAIAMTMTTNISAQDVKLRPDNIDEVVKAMTLEEKATLLVGGEYDFWTPMPVAGGSSKTVPGAAGSTVAIPRLGIPETILTDGPAGVRINAERYNSDGTKQAKTYYATGFPIGTCLASSWNTDLANRVGRAIGDEVKEYNCDVILGPGVNIHRNPLCGRNFEYYSEDPLLTGKIAAAYINGVQSEGAGVSIKHFAVNSQETNRQFVDERVTQRAAREIYLRGFEIAIRESDPWTVMSSYNLVNGVFAQGSYDLLTAILRKDWGFKGIVMTDWYGKREGAGLYTIDEVKAGNDLMEPGGKDQIADIIKGVNEGKLAMVDVDVCVKRILEYIVRTPHFKGYKATNTPDLKAHAAITRETAAEGMVLLKNGRSPLPTSPGGGDVKNVLPLDVEKYGTIALFGTGSYNFLSGGVGSGCVHTPYIVDLVEGLNNVGIKTTDDLTEIYKKYIDYAKLKFEADRPNERWFEAPDLGDQKMPEIEISQLCLSRQMAKSDAAIVTISRQAGEGIDRKIEGEFNLTDVEKKMIQNVCTAYHAAGKPVIVVINSGSVIETASWQAWPDAILVAWQPGEEGGNSVVDILTGKVNPSGRLTMTWPLAAEDHPSTQAFPYDMDLFTYECAKSGTSKVHTRDYTNHTEDIWVGYRYFDTWQKHVAYPFGYGLSYTTFDFSNMKAKKSGDKVICSVTVKNTGKVAGKQVAQLYVAAPEKGLSKPAKELKAFAKTRLLQPGESETLQMTVNQRDLASFDEANSQWLVEPGTYSFLVGDNVESILGKASLAIDKYTEPVSNVLAPQEKFDILKK